LLLILLLVTLVGYCSFRLGHFLLTWDRLEVKSFKLVNPPQVDGAALQTILNTHRGNILSLNVDELQKTLHRMPQVKDVSVYRRLPDVVEIHFSLRKPVLQFHSAAGIWYYDGEGNRLYQARALQDDLMTCRDMAEKEMISIGKMTRELAPLQQNIEYLSFKRPYGLIVKLKGYDEIFYPGEQDFYNKISRFIKIRSMDVLTPYQIKVVDLRFSDRIYVEHATETEEVTSS
jgi:cell division septal protein FtsQ